MFKDFKELKEFSKFLYQDIFNKCSCFYHNFEICEFKQFLKYLLS